ncbi:MAG: glycosyltransferase [Deltaproteobacteria bacterium]|nr:glycosyltransferase [Deltaproteobacteria bacterium]
MTAALLAIFHSFGLILFILGIQGLIFLPLTLVYELWKIRRLRTIPSFDGKVSILIPVYNEEKTIRATILSVQESDYDNKEIIVINDGSTDGTEDAVRDLIDRGEIIYISKPNGGKASALNRGIEAATGEIVLFTDADSLFLLRTIRQMVRWFGDTSIDAVCGNDMPLHPASPIQKFLAITTHIGTGFVRRALSVMRCLPIITGNLGAIRTAALREIGGFMEIWGEDLEVTFRLYKNGKRTIFDPDPKVVAECPGTFTALWKQRVRWMRSYIKISFLHKDLFFNPKWRPFSFYLPINFFNMTIIPFLQIALILLIPWAYFTDRIYFIDTVEFLTYLGLIFFIVIAIYSILLDRGFRDLLYLPYGILILPLSYFYNLVTAYSWWQEAKRAEERWEQTERRGIVTIEKRRWEQVIVGLLLIVASSAATYYYIGGTTSSRSYKAAFTLGLSTHFDAWGDWREAMSNLGKRPMVDMAKTVGIGAGRVEWSYFKWIGHRENWSNHQKGAQEDLLLTATRFFQKKGFKAAAIVDLYAPAYIKEHPETASVRWDGFVSPEQVGFIDTVEGEYGRLIIDMVEYIAKNYPVDIINLTELSYYSYSYNDNDLHSYEAYHERKGWPRNSIGDVDKEDPSIWEWRSVLMERYIKEVAAVVHREDKKLYIDVPVSWDDFSRNGMESGLDYRRILKHADKIIVWNYYYLQGEPPAISEKLSQYLADNFPLNSFYISVGLWGDKTPVGTQSFAEAIASTLKGGATQIWVTPDYLVTDKHWNELLLYLKREKETL